MLSLAPGVPRRPMESKTDGLEIHGVSSASMMRTRAAPLPGCQGSTDVVGVCDHLSTAYGVFLRALDFLIRSIIRSCPRAASSARL
jgi:hypothetical protein